VNTRHKPARASQISTIPALPITQLHRYQNKHLITPLFSHRCAHLRLYPLCFDTLHKNTWGAVVAQPPTFLSRFGTKSGPSQKEAEGSLALLGMTAGRRAARPRRRSLHKSLTTSYGSRTASHKSRITSHASKVLNCKLSTENCRLRFTGGGANFRSRLFLVVHTPLYAEVPRTQEHAHE
jgi:hypothetical protein